MKRLLLTAAAFAALTVTANAEECVIERLSNVPAGWVHSRPGLDQPDLWKLAEGAHVKYCGKWTVDDHMPTPIIWHWVSFRFYEEPWEHKGWVSTRILTPALLPQSTMTTEPAPTPTRSNVEAQSPQPQTPPDITTGRSAAPADKTEAAPMTNTGQAIQVAAAPPQTATLGLSDITRIHATYENNQARFFRDFPGKILSATLPFHGTVENMFSKGTFNVYFGEGGVFGTGDVTCVTSAPDDIRQVADFNKGDNIAISGTIKDHIMGAILLDSCTVDAIHS